MLGWANDFHLEGEPDLRGRRYARAQAVPPVVVSEVRGEGREIRSLSGREAGGRLRLGASECADAQPRVSKVMISTEVRASQIRMIGSTTGERNRSQCGN